MFISKLIERVSIGNLYAESKNGIKVYKYVGDSGIVKLSSFLPDGQPYKTITKQNLDGLSCIPKRYILSSQGHNTEVQNHQNGITTRIRNIKTQYESLTSSKTEPTGFEKEYSLHNTKDGNYIGKLIYIEEKPTKGIKINAEYDYAGNEISRETNEFSIIA